MAVVCDVVFDDESSEQLDIDSLSMMGAQREITAYLIDRGYNPVGRWEARARTDGKAAEVSRKFKVASDRRTKVAAQDTRVSA